MSDAMKYEAKQTEDKEREVFIDAERELKYLI